MSFLKRLLECFHEHFPSDERGKNRESVLRTFCLWPGATPRVLARKKRVHRGSLPATERFLPRYVLAWSSWLVLLHQLLGRAVAERQRNGSGTSSGTCRSAYPGGKALKQVMFAR